MKSRYLLGAAALAVFILCSAFSCGGSSNNNEHAAANAGINLMLTNQPVPIFPTSAMRQETIEIEAIQALGTPTTAFFFPPGQGPGIPGSHPFKTCPAEGEPIPNTTSLTNPSQLVAGANTQGGVVAQMDPNGTYTPAASTGTYVLCNNANGGQKLTYWEGDVYDESGAAVWNQSTLMIDSIGASELPVCVIEHSSSGDSTGLSSGTPYYHCTKAAA
jgi:hypothetical protein